MSGSPSSPPGGTAWSPWESSGRSGSPEVRSRAGSPGGGCTASTAACTRSGTRRSPERGAISLPSSPAARGPSSGHRSAAALRGLLRWAGAIEVSTPRSGGPRRGITVHTTRRLEPADRAIVDSIPVTSVARTLVDLAEVRSEPHLANAVHEAEVQRLFDLGAVREAQARVSGRASRHCLDRVLADYAPRPFTRSGAESAFSHVCATAGLPSPGRPSRSAATRSTSCGPTAGGRRGRRRGGASHATGPSTRTAGATASWPSWVPDPAGRRGVDLREPDPLGRQLRSVLGDPTRR